MTQNIHFPSHRYNIVGEIELSRQIYPMCSAIYWNGSGYIMVEINTGLHMGSIKPISIQYKTLQHLLDQFDQQSVIYPVLPNTIIWWNLI